jgi:hypothetical protein
MTLRHRPKAIANLRLASLQDYILIEDEPDLSPRTTLPSQPRRLPRKVHDDTYEDITASFRRFTWHRPELERGLDQYKRFLEDMAVPSRDAVEPWVDWVREILGWEERWILENPGIVKTEIVRRFEDGASTQGSDERVVLQKVPSIETVDERRHGAQSRLGFREEYDSRGPSARSKTGPASHRQVIPSVTYREEEMRSQGWRMRLPHVAPRPLSALGFETVGLRRQLSSIKRRALTNPWRRSHARE